MTLTRMMKPARGTSSVVTFACLLIIWGCTDNVGEVSSLEGDHSGAAGDSRDISQPDVQVACLTLSEQLDCYETGLGRGDPPGSVDPVVLADGLYFVGDQSTNLVLIEARDGSDGMVLLNSGRANTVGRSIANMQALGLDPGRIRVVMATHEHLVGHGSLRYFSETVGAELWIHEDAATRGAEGRCACDQFVEGVDDDARFNRAFIPYAPDRVWSAGEAVSVLGINFVFHGVPIHTPGTTYIQFDIIHDGITYQVGMVGGEDSSPASAWGPSPTPSRADKTTWLTAVRDLPIDIALHAHTDMQIDIDGMRKNYEIYQDVATVGTPAPLLDNTRWATYVGRQAARYGTQ